MLTVRWGTQLRALRQDGPALVIGDKAKPTGVIDKLIAATTAGELDRLIEQASRTRLSSKQKSEQRKAFLGRRLFR